MTRTRIAEAARRLFARDGYGATTIAAIAAEAGVAVQTVYAVYRSKPGILRALRDGVVRDPKADELYRSALVEPRMERKLELFARSIRTRWEHGEEVVSISDQAAATDSSVKKEVARAISARRNGLAELARSIGGGDVARTHAILDALSLPQVYRELTDVHGWSADDYEAWLAAALKQLVALRA